jgi:hypothetical protein
MVDLSNMNLKSKALYLSQAPTAFLTASPCRSSYVTNHQSDGWSLRPPQAVTRDAESRHHVRLAANAAAMRLLAHLKLFVFRALTTEPVLAAGLVELVALIVPAAQLGQALEAHLGGP